MRTFTLELCEGAAGEAVYLNGLRLAGPRHNGIMRTTRSWKVRLDVLQDALAAGSRRAETNEDLAQCEASQSGAKRNAQPPPSPDKEK